MRWYVFPLWGSLMGTLLSWSIFALIPGDQGWVAAPMTLAIGGLGYLLGVIAEGVSGR